MKLNLITTLAACAVAATALAQTPITAPSVKDPPPKNPWDASIAAGLTITRGNSRTILFSGSAKATKKWDKNEVDLLADAVYGKNEDTTSAQSAHAAGQYNRLFTERLFGYLRVEGLYDRVADIDYRITVSPGVGYYFIKTTNTLLSAEVGPGYIYEKDGPITTRDAAGNPVSVTPSSDHSYMTLRGAEKFEQKLSQTAKLWQSFEILPQVDRFQNYIINAEIGVESAMSKKLSLQVVLQDSYHSEPPVHRLKNDIKLISGVKYKF